MVRRSKLLYIKCFMVLAMVLTLLVPGKSVFANATNVGTKFIDVKNYLIQINYLTDKGIIKGYQDGTFKPGNDVSRLQAVQMILNQKGIDPTKMSVKDPGFKDMQPGDYGYEAAAVGASLGIIHGKEDGTFDPAGHLTRGQLASILVNAYNLTGQYSGSFTDVKQGVWPYDAVNTLAANHITQGYTDGTFRPNEFISRQHFAVFLYNYLTGVGSVPPTSGGTTEPPTSGDTTTTPTVEDTTPPTVNGITYKFNSVLDVVYITFDEPVVVNGDWELDSPTSNGTVLGFKSIKSGTDLNHDGVVQGNEEESTFKFYGQLDENTDYTLAITGGTVTDLSGNSITADKTLTFTTGTR